MTRTRQLPLTGWTALALSAWLGVSLVGATDGAGVLLGFTQPTRAVTLASLETGRLAVVPVQEGELVTAGALAFSLDDSVQRQRVAIAKAHAESMLAVELARVRLTYAELEMQRVTALAKSSAVSAKELSDAQVGFDVAKLNLASAEFEHAQAIREHELETALLERLHVRAPFDGYIAECLQTVGQTVADNEGIVELVQLDPLRVTFDCPIEYAAALRIGRQVPITPLDGLAEPRTGQVTYIGRVADAASQTFKVKIELANPDGAWMAGMRVNLDLNAVLASTDTAGQRTAAKDAPRRP